MASLSSTPRPFRAKRLLPVLLIAALAGCASLGPDYRAPASVAPAAWQAVPLDGMLTGSPANLSRWWEQLSDPLLSSLIDDALLANPVTRSLCDPIRIRT